MGLLSKLFGGGGGSSSTSTTKQEESNLVADNRVTGENSTTLKLDPQVTGDDNELNLYNSFERVDNEIIKEALGFGAKIFEESTDSINETVLESLNLVEDATAEANETLNHTIDVLEDTFRDTGDILENINQENSNLLNFIAEQSFTVVGESLDEFAEQTAAQTDKTFEVVDGVVTTLAESQRSETAKLSGDFTKTMLIVAGLVSISFILIGNK